MKKNDYILIGIILFIGIVSSIIFAVVENNNKQTDGIATVYYNNERILDIYLTDGSYNIIDESRVISIDEEAKEYHILGSNPYGVLIKYKDNSVGVIDEESPKNICQYQGFSNSSLSPITCLPNNILIVIKAKTTDVDTIGG
jgi:hypothetical protein